MGGSKSADFVEVGEALFREMWAVATTSGTCMVANISSPVSPVNSKHTIPSSP